MSEIVALLLDEDLPPVRLGALLRDARKRRGWKRPKAAARAGTTAKRLRAYERGEKPVPTEVRLRLVECYGDDLTAHVPMRVPVRANSDWLIVGELELPLVFGSAEEILTGYVKIVQRVRRSKPGEPLVLRSTDVVALAAVLNADRGDIEERLAELLGCTVGEARALHAELLRRKVLLPVAGLAAGVAAFAGVAHAAQSDDPKPARPMPPATEVAAHHDAPETHKNVETERAQPAPPAPAPVHAEPEWPTWPRPADEPVTHATVPPAEQPADTVNPIIPQPAEDGVVSVLPGEGPFIIIGDSITEIDD
jgi:transcriptional regulator with XRE-family HTH domain